MLVDPGKLARCHFLRFNDNIARVGDKAALAAIEAPSALPSYHLAIMKQIVPGTGLSLLEQFRATRTNGNWMKALREADENALPFMFASLPWGRQEDVPECSDAEMSGLLQCYISILDRLGALEQNKERTVLFLTPEEDDCISGFLEHAAFERLCGRDVDPLQDMGVCWLVGDGCSLVIDVAGCSPDVAKTMRRLARNRDVLDCVVAAPMTEIVERLSEGRFDGKRIRQIAKDASSQKPPDLLPPGVLAVNAKYDGEDEIKALLSECRSYSSAWFDAFRKGLSARFVRPKGAGMPEDKMQLAFLLGELYDVRQSAFAEVERQKTTPLTGYSPAMPARGGTSAGASRDRPVLDSRVLDLCERITEAGGRVERVFSGVDCPIPDYGRCGTAQEQVAAYARAVGDVIGTCQLRPIVVVMPMSGEPDFFWYKLWECSLLLFMDIDNIMVFVACSGQDDAVERICSEMGVEMMSGSASDKWDATISEDGGNRIRLGANAEGQLSEHGRRILEYIVVSSSMSCLMDEIAPELCVDNRLFRIDESVFLGYQPVSEDIWPEYPENLKLVREVIECESFEERLMRNYGELYRRAAEAVCIWGSALAEGGFEVIAGERGFSPKRAGDAAKILGVDNMLAAWAAGVPYDDIVR